MITPGTGVAINQIKSRKIDKVADLIKIQQQLRSSVTVVLSVGYTTNTVILS